jgi:hypothetical protein
MFVIEPDSTGGMTEGRAAIRAAAGLSAGSVKEFHLMSNSPLGTRSSVPSLFVLEFV